jgi:hypothetical protein
VAVAETIPISRREENMSDRICRMDIGHAEHVDENGIEHAGSAQARRGRGGSDGECCTAYIERVRKREVVGWRCDHIEGCGKLIEMGDFCPYHRYGKRDPLYTDPSEEGGGDG